MIPKKIPKFVEHKEFYTHNEYRVMVLTDIAPPYAVVEYNVLAGLWIPSLEKDYTIYPQQFYEMRTRIGYTLEKVEEEMKEIYTKEQILEWKKNFKK